MFHSSSIFDTYVNPKNNSNIPNEYRQPIIKDSIANLSSFESYCGEDWVKYFDSFGNESKYIIDRLKEVLHPQGEEKCNTSKLLEWAKNIGLGVLRIGMGITITSSGDWKVNQDFMRVFVEDHVILVKRIDGKDAETLLIYNHQTGSYDYADQVLKNLLAEWWTAVGYSHQLWNPGIEQRQIEYTKRLCTGIDQSKFDVGRYAFANKTLETINSTVNWVDHSPDHLLTMHSNVFYDPEADCEQFNHFLNDIFDGDQEVTDFMAEWFGYVLSDSFDANSFLILLGSGSNGKSLLMSTLVNLIGERQTSAVTMDRLDSDFGLQPIINSKLNLASENNSSINSSAHLKSVTAGEPVSVNRKGIEEVTMRLRAKMVFSFNTQPIIDDSSYGMERRIHIVKFEKSFTGENQDTTLGIKLNSEASGILNFAVMGLKRLISNNFRFTDSKKMLADRKKLFARLKPLNAFIQSELVEKQGSKMLTVDIHNKFEQWCEINDVPMGKLSSAKPFWRAFDATFEDVYRYKPSRRKSNGIGLIDDIAARIKE